MLRDYQKNDILKIISSLEENKKTLYQLPTGGGKTIIATSIAKRYSTVFLVHREELLDQTYQSYKKAGLDVGLVQSGKPVTKHKHYIAMVQTLGRDLDIIPPPDLVIADEAHITVSKTYQKIFGHWCEGKYHTTWKLPVRQSKLLGLTATPKRLDGRPLCPPYEVLIEGPSIKSLIEQGYLADYELLGPPEKLNLKGVKTSMGDYNITDLIERVSGTNLTGNAVKEYKKYLSGKQAIAFCINVEHSKSVAETFIEAGISAAHIDGSTPHKERKELIEKFRRGEISVLTNCNLFIEGFDVPDIQGVIMLRPTQSLSLLRQAWGRGLRPKADGSKAIILDHAGNYARHGLPDDSIEWNLTGKVNNKEGGARLKACPECYRVCRVTASFCSRCKYIFKAEVKKIKQNVKVDLEVIRREKPLTKWSPQFWAEIRACKNQGEMRTVAIRAGLKPGFGWFMWKAFRIEHKPIPEYGYVKL